MKTRTKETTQEAPNGRSRLLHSALKLFATKGFDGTSVRDIAAHAGLSIGLVRRHFGSKEGLRSAVDQFVVDKMRPLYGAIRDEAGWSEVAVQFAKQEKDALLYLRFVFLDPNAASQAFFADYFAAVRQFIRDVKREGRLAKGLDEEWAAYFLMFLQLGPLIVDPLATKAFGRSMYAPGRVRARNRTFRMIQAGGLLKEPD